MPFWRRDEALHEKLAREAGLSIRGVPAPHDTTPRLEVGIHGVARPRRWDAVESVDAPSLVGDTLEFVALPDGTLLVGDDIPDQPDGALTPLADAVERSLSPPYRVEAQRSEGTLWAVAARGIEVVELPPDIPGDEVSLAVQDGKQTLLVDGELASGHVPELELLGRERYAGFVVHARRLDGALWEVRIAAL